MQHDRNPLGIRMLQKIGRRVAPPLAVEYRPSDLRPLQMFIREPIVWTNSRLQQAVPHRRLPLPHRRLERHHLLHPLVRLVHQPSVPSGCLHVGGGGPRVEAGVDAAAAAQHTRPRVHDAVLRDEALRGGRGGEVGQGAPELRQGGDVRVVEGGAATLQEEDARILGQRGGEGAAGGAPADDDVVVVGDSRR